MLHSGNSPFSPVECQRTSRVGQHNMSKLVSQAATLAPQVVAAAKPKLAKFLKYARVELIPPSPAELPEVARGFANVIRAARQGKWKNMTVKECWLNTLVFTEILCWFWAGECIGKGTIVGYQV